MGKFIQRHGTTVCTGQSVAIRGVVGVLCRADACHYGLVTAAILSRIILTIVVLTGLVSAGLSLSTSVIIALLPAPTPQTRSKMQARGLADKPAAQWLIIGPSSAQ